AEGPTMDASKMTNASPVSDLHRPRARRFIRYALDKRVTVVRDLNTSDKLSGRCYQVGEGGMGVMLAGGVEIGGMVTLELTQMDPATCTNETLRMPAIVRDRRGFHHGFEFIAVGTSTRKAVRNILRETNGVKAS